MHVRQFRAHSSSLFGLEMAVQIAMIWFFLKRDGALAALVLTVFSAGCQPHFTCQRGGRIDAPAAVETAASIATVGGDVSNYAFDGDDDVPLAFPKLHRLHGSLSCWSDACVVDTGSMFPELTTLDGDSDASNGDDLAAVAFSKLTTGNDVMVLGNDYLTAVSLPALRDTAIL